MKRYLLVLLCLFPAGVLAQPTRTNPLTADNVACNAAQLGRLLNRLDAGSRQLFVTYSDAGSLYEGLAVVEQGVFADRLTPEYDLAFHFNASLRELLLNPARPPLPQISLTREDSASNLVRPTNPHALTVTLNPLLATTPPESGLLSINNLEVPADAAAYNGFRETSAGPGRGLAQDGLTTACHRNLTAFDRRIFALLERVVRTSAADFLGGQDFSFVTTSATIFRGADPHTYRVDVYLGLQTLLNADARMAVAVRVDWDEQGRLTTGRLTVLPPCAVPGLGECTGASVNHFATVQLQLIPPVLPGTELWSAADPRWRSITAGLGQGNPPPPVDVDFAALLAGTAWNTGGL